MEREEQKVEPQAWCGFAAAAVPCYPCIRDRQSPGGMGTERRRQMERAKCFLRSLCRGIASFRPVWGLVQIE